MGAGVNLETGTVMLHVAFRVFYLAVLGALSSLSGVWECVCVCGVGDFWASGLENVRLIFLALISTLSPSYFALPNSAMDFNLAMSGVWVECLSLAV